jgi:two-component system response regulator RegA
MNVLGPKAPTSILLIDDDDLIAGSLRQVLLMERCDVDVALDPRTALALLAGRRYDIVLIDPYLTGGVHHDRRALVDEVRVLQPSAKVIVLTGYGSADLVRSVADGSVSAFIAKPQPISVLTEFLIGTPRSVTVPPFPTNVPEDCS